MADLRVTSDGPPSNRAARALVNGSGAGSGLAVPLSVLAASVVILVINLAITLRNGSSAYRAGSYVPGDNCNVVQCVGEKGERGEAGPAGPAGGPVSFFAAKQCFLTKLLLHNDRASAESKESRASPVKRGTPESADRRVCVTILTQCACKARLAIAGRRETLASVVCKADPATLVRRACPDRLALRE